MRSSVEESILAKLADSMFASVLIVALYTAGAGCFGFLGLG